MKASSSRSDSRARAVGVRGLVIAVAALLIAALMGAVTTTSATARSNDPGPGPFSDWNCKSQDGRDPVVLLHGLGGQRTTNWFYHGKKLKRQGYCVYSLTYGQGIAGNLLAGLGSMRDSSKQVASFVDQVLRETGAEKVDLVGHSEGTTVGAYYLKFDGGKDKVRDFVGFGSNFKGTTLSGLEKLIKRVLPYIRNVEEFVNEVCAACLEFLPGSDFLKDLNDGGVAVDGVNYTSIRSKTDFIVTPGDSSLIDGEGNTNILLQDECRRDISGHISMAISPNVTQLITRGIDPQNAPAFRCKFALPLPF